MKIILIMGLPGAGKTTLADELAPILKAKSICTKLSHGTLSSAL